MPHTHGTLINVEEHFGPDPSAKRWYVDPTSRYNRNRIAPSVPTLIELLVQNGYRTAITSKFHMAPHDRFKFDVWIDGEISGTDTASGQAASLEQFMLESNRAGRPFFVMVNIRSPHRPLSRYQANSQPDPAPEVVEVPASLPQTPVVVEDWIRYLKAVQRTDDQVGRVLAALTSAGLEDDTIVIFMGDNGPAYHDSKWTPYDLGLRMALMMKGPGIEVGLVTDELASLIDVMPTLLDLVGISLPATLQGNSLGPFVTGRSTTTGREYVSGELAHPSGHVEHTIHDGQQLHLIHRSNVLAPRLVPADNRDLSPWENPVYNETIAQQGSFPAAYERLRRIDNGALGGIPPTVELYSLRRDPWEVDDLSQTPAYAPSVNRLLTALQVDAVQTGDKDVRIFGIVPSTWNAPFSGADPFNGVSDTLDELPTWSTVLVGTANEDFSLDGSIVDAPRGHRILALFDVAGRGAADDFETSVATRFVGYGVGGGLVFGYTDNDNFFEFQLLDGRSIAGGKGKDLRLRRRENGAERDLVYADHLPDYSGGWYDVRVAYTAETHTLQLRIVDNQGAIYFERSLVLDHPLPADSWFGFSSWSSNSSRFDDFSLNLTAGTPPNGDLPLLGDFDGDRQLSLADAILLRSAYGSSTPTTARFNFVLSDEVVNEADMDYWLQTLVPIVIGAESGSR